MTANGDDARQRASIDRLLAALEADDMGVRAAVFDEVRAAFGIRPGSNDWRGEMHAAWEAARGDGGAAEALTDAARAIADGDTNKRKETSAGDDDKKRRQIVLTAASAIPLRRVRWLWHERVALGTLALLAGPEGLGKSTLAYWLAARITRGELPGEYNGTPRAVLVCATEDSWAHTIGPRLLAHGADRDIVYRVDVEVDETIHAELNLPRDLVELERTAAETKAALLILDPLMSRLDVSLDTHRDGEVRRALEPLVATCEASGLATVGLIHHNKSGSTDPLNVVMASKAFTAVARSVQTVIRDPDDETGGRRLFGTPKNNLGRGDLPVMSFTVVTFEYDTDDGPGYTGQLVWGDDVAGSIHDALARSARDPDKSTAEKDAVAWLREYMAENARELGCLDGDIGVEAADAKEAGEANGHSRTTMFRAQKKLGIFAEKGRGEFRSRWFWVFRHDDSAPEDPNLPRGESLMESSVPKGGETPGRDEDSEDSKIPVLGASWNLGELWPTSSSPLEPEDLFFGPSSPPRPDDIDIADDPFS